MNERKNFYMVLLIVVALTFLVQVIENGQQKRIEKIKNDTAYTTELLKPIKLKQ